MFRILLVAFALLVAPSIKASDEEEFGFTPPDADNVVEFRIPAGTGQGPWNTKEKTVKVKVGQILRIVNDDSIPHYLHTPGKPCPHGTGPFGPGKSYDCKISKPANPDRDLVYDHNFGPKSRFYVEATP